EKHLEDQGAGLRFLSRPTNSPSAMRLREAIASKLPKARFYTYASVSDANIRQGSKIAFGKAYAPVVDYENAKVIVALDSDFLGVESGSVRASRGFAKHRRIESPKAEMNRLYAVE